jgi:hypothetical protein
MRASLAALAAVAAATAFAAGPVTAQAMARGTAVPEAVNNSAKTPSLSLAIGPRGDPEIAAIGKHATLLYYTIVHGKWRHTQVAGAGTAESGPSLVNLGGNNAAIAVEGPHNVLLLFTLRSGHWTRQTIAGPGSAWSAPSLASGPEGPGIAVDGPANSLWFYWFERGQWHNNEVLIADTFSAPSLIFRGTHGAVPGDPVSEADIAVEGFDHDLEYAYAIPGLTTWNVLPADSGKPLAYSAPSIIVTDGADPVHGIVFMAMEGPRHRLVLLAYSDRVFEVFNVAKTNNTVYSAPSVGQNLGDLKRPVVVAFQGHGSKVYEFLLFTSGRTKYDVVGSVHADSAPAAGAGSPTDSSDDVIVEGAGNTLWFFHAPRPASSTGVPKFAGVEIGGGGSTFGG